MEKREGENPNTKGQKTEERQRGRNPVLPPDICIPDGEAHVFGDRLYIYGSRDSEEETYCSETYRVVSTGDMREWTVHGTSFDGNDVPWAGTKSRKKYPMAAMDLRNPTPVTRKMLQDMKVPIDKIPRFLRPKQLDFGQYSKTPQYLFAPDCIEKDGRYYLYFCMADYTEGVAVSDRPEGPFGNPVQLPCKGIDPAIFTDEDGKSYFYWGQFRACAVPLHDDMVSFDEREIVRNIVTEEEHGFHEGSSMRKRNGIYYYVYPCVYRGGKPTCLAYATAEHPLGPFTYRGILIDNAKCDPQSWNIHGSIQEFQGQWYVIYHRSSRNSNFHRRLCIEKINFHADGTIDEVKMTSIGAGEPFVLGEKIGGWRACEVDGGAYINGEELVMCDGSSAVIRYVSWGSVPVRLRAESTGAGSVCAYADGKPLDEAGAGTHEVVLCCAGNCVVQAVTFEEEKNE